MSEETDKFTDLAAAKEAAFRRAIRTNAPAAVVSSRDYFYVEAEGGIIRAWEQTIGTYSKSGKWTEF